MTPERVEVAGDTLSATLRALASTALDISVTLTAAADIREGEPGRDADAAVALLARRAERLVTDLAAHLRRFPVV